MHEVLTDLARCLKKVLAEPPVFSPDCFSTPGGGPHSWFGWSLSSDIFLTPSCLIFWSPGARPATAVHPPSGFPEALCRDDPFVAFRLVQVLLFTTFSAKHVIAFWNENLRGLTPFSSHCAFSIFLRPFYCFSHIYGRFCVCHCYASLSYIPLRPWPRRVKGHASPLPSVPPQRPPFGRPHRSPLYPSFNPPAFPPFGPQPRPQLL